MMTMVINDDYDDYDFSDIDMSDYDLSANA